MSVTVENPQCFPLGIDCFAPKDVIVGLGEELAHQLGDEQTWEITPSEVFIAEDLSEQWAYENPSRTADNEVALQIRFCFPSAELCQAATESVIEHLQSLNPDPVFGVVAWSTTNRIS